LKKSPTELFDEVVKKPVSDFYKMDWTDFLEKYDKFTLKDYLKEEGGLSNGAIEIIGETRWQKQLAEKITENKTILFAGVFLNFEAFMNLALVESVLEECTFGHTQLVKVTDGMDLIPRGFLPTLGRDIRYNAIVSKITQTQMGVHVE
jgi:monoamine oxidase